MERGAFWAKGQMIGGGAPSIHYYYPLKGDNFESEKAPKILK